MAVPPLLIAGLGCAALLLVVTGGRALARRAAWTWLQFLLAALAVTLTFLGLTLADSATPQPMIAVLIAAVVLIAAGLLLALSQRPRDRAAGGWNQSAGIALTGVGGFLMLTLLLAAGTAALTPAAAPRHTLVTLPEPTSPAAAAADQLQNAASVHKPGADTREQPITTTEPRQFALTPLPSQYVGVTPTLPPSDAAADQLAAATADAPALCQGIVQNNLNLRTGPGVAYERVLTIPYATQLSVGARSADGGWFWVEDGAASGWVSAPYVVLNATCPPLPVRAQPAS